MAGLLFSSLLFALHFSSSSAGNTTCADSGMDWYTDLVGETPCRTYERLRQICNNQYQVGIMNVNTPPDFCDEQVADCCCNSISFALSMMCLTCQQGFSQSSTGFDAGKGAYQMYLTAGRDGFCHPNTNQSFPDNIQTAVCNQKIKVFDSLYSLFWGDGSWFYEFTAQTLTKDINIQANNTFTHCDSTTLHSTSASDGSTPSTSSSSSSGAPTGFGSSDNSNGNNNNSSSSSSSGMSGGAIAGIAVGAFALLALLGLFFWFWRKRARSYGQRTYTGQVIIDGNGPDGRGGGDSPGGSFGGPRNPTSPTMAQISPYPYAYSSVPSSHSRTFSQNAPSNPFSGPGSTSDYSQSQSQYQTSYYPQSQSGSGSGSSVTGSGSGSGSASNANSNSNSRSAAGSGSGAAGVAASSVARSNSTRKGPLPSIPSPSLSSTQQGQLGQQGLGQGSGLYDDEDGERHRDAGPVPESMLQRAPSGRLPPAYGEQFG